MDTHRPRSAATLLVVSLAGCTTSITDVTPLTGPPLGVEAIHYAEDGVPFMVRGRLGTARSPIVNVDDAAVALADALPALTAMFRVQASDLVATHVLSDELGMTHVGFAQHKHALPVIGGDFVVHLDADRAIASVNGSIRDDSTLPSDPRISADTAQSIAAGATGDVDVRGSDLVYIIATSDSAMHLAWQVQVTGRNELLDDLVYVDALSGAVVDRRPQVFTAKTREIRNGNNCSYPFGCSSTTIVGTEANPPANDAVALAAFTNTGITYDCYQTLFNRDSYDNNGSKLTSLVHIVFQTPNGTSGNNAAWSGNRMVYGDGDGDKMSPLANSLDVTAHELTHGVTGTTAKLAYQNEPGALNEGMSDIMAAVCEAWHDGAVTADTWLMGEDIFTPNTPGDALRYMANPTADASLYPPALGGSRDFYPERYQGTDDNGGVHLNSGIPNLAFQLLVAGGTHPRAKTAFAVPAIGITKAGAIFQRALTQGYFTSTTNLAQARAQTEMVATQLYPGNTSTAVAFAWAAVGVGPAPQPADTTPPTVTITSPTDGARVLAGFAVTVEASDDVAVDRVELAIDGAPAGSDDTAPYEFASDPALAVGSHTIQATAFDGVNQASTSITITIGEPGSVCTSDAECDDGETCQAGTCTPSGGSETGDGGGCGCNTNGDRGIAGNLILALGTLLVVGRRRRGSEKRSVDV
jgi:Zn-dependent metalloprotease